MLYSLIYMQIQPPTVALLSDSELKDLGVETVGERAHLRKRCRERVKSKRVLCVCPAIKCFLR